MILLATVCLRETIFPIKFATGLMVMLPHPDE